MLVHNASRSGSSRSGATHTPLRKKNIVKRKERPLLQTLFIAVAFLNTAKRNILIFFLIRI